MSNLIFNTQSNNIINIFEDTVSKIKFYPSDQFNILATSDWNSKINIFNVDFNIINNNPRFEIRHLYSQQLNSPLLTLTWFPNSYNLLTSDIEGVIYNINIETNQTLTLGRHSSGCKELLMFNVNNNNILISGGWDGFIHFWDFRCSNPIFSLNQGKKIYCMDKGNNLLLIGYEKRILQYYDLSKFGHNRFNYELEFESNLNHQTKSVCAFPNDDRFAIGSIGGKITIKSTKEINLENKKLKFTDKGDFSFKTHRNNSSNNINYAYSVNCISYNKVYKTFASGGSDCKVIFFDIENKREVISSYDNNSQVNSIDFNYKGDLFAYSLGYDWSEGIYGKIDSVPKVGIHYLKWNEKILNL